MDLEEIKKKWIEFVASIAPEDRLSVQDAMLNFSERQELGESIDDWDTEWDTELIEFCVAHYDDMEEKILDNASYAVETEEGCYDITFEFDEEYYNYLSPDWEARFGEVLYERCLKILAINREDVTEFTYEGRKPESKLDVTIYTKSK